ncbi:usherin isoform X7 [Crotalus tigris]|uniref:usherin isoform X7 n=1 Tax=Crotalus tigris TaxID=88082 RepID=UPI00192F5181|nr:usherin isoform X7 [Crotalus tigris]
MICLVLHCGFLLHAIETSITVYYITLPLASSQGHFPSLENVGAFKNISTVPTQATCGLPERSTFCQSSAVVESINFCIRQFCIQKCPYRSSPASYAAILSEGLGNVIQQDENDVPPGSFSNTSIIFHGEKDCFSTPRPRKLAISFTLTVWLKPEKEGAMCMVEKIVHGQTVFKLTISEKETVFYYRTINGLQLPIKVMTLGKILVKKWNHLSVQVHHNRISFFINGLEDDDTTFDSRILTGLIADPSVGGVWRIGQNLNGSEQFVGRMQDFRLYQMALTNRDIFEVWSGKFPQLRIQSECRCPGSHPRVHPLVQRYCIPNGADDTTNDRVLRLNPEAHPLSYINDNDIGTTWISSIFSTTEHLRHGVTITIDLENGQFQVFYVIIQFFSPQPEAIRIQRKKQPSIGWEDWQYFARDCSVFGMENNGSLQYPDSVNCLQLPSHTPYSNGNITFSVLNPEPNHRPGYNDFYNTPSLQEFVKVSKIKIHLFDQYHTTMPWVNAGHRYYGIDEITISGRCNCFGHADHCDTSHSPYKCLCSKESYTEGNNCDRCQPLYNDKPFHPGDQVHAYNCKPCQCFSHAVSCHYNRTIDYFPNEYYRGGGGVCDNCQHNTSGRNCELCNDFFYRHIDADLSALDICKPCECYSAGTKNDSCLCNKIGGKCNCKRHVSGRQCNQCQEGFYNLQKFNPDGCSPCSCNASGTVDGDTTCHQNSGQCKCKENVIGLRCDQCKSGYKVIQNIKQVGCEPCLCNINGSMNNVCNPSTGQCTCKQGVKGTHCETCIDGFYWMDAFGCKPCSCQIAGSVSDTLCDPKTGQCICKPNFGGRQCDDCLNEYYKEWQNTALFCVPCNCDKSGSVNGSLVCDKLTGQCPCKSGVTALQCNQCKSYMYNLTVQNILGCMPCDCDPLGTLPGAACDQTSGQCICQPHRHGRRCEKCKPGFYISAHGESSCLPCFCHPSGSISNICDTLTGQCVCHDSSVSGMKCDHCSDNYFGFNSETGKCQHCNCHPAGAINWTCHSITGQCLCKQFAAGLKCDNCVPNASNLDVHNLFGCSKTPSQQPPPKGQTVNSSVIRVTWNPPDSPNSNWLAYKLYRNGSQIYTTEDYLPYSLQVFVDSNLLPYTLYTYHLEASNIHGFTRSIELTYRTQPGIPLGNLHLNPVFPVGPYSISFNWTALSNDTGPIEKYILTCISSFEHQSCGQHESLGTSITVWNLVPFKKYSFYVQACTSGGCLLSQQLSIITAQAPPEEQLPPVIQNISSTELAVEWVPPRKTNGVIIRYELYMKGGVQSNGSHVPPENCIFQTSGWFDLHPAEESLDEKALMPLVTSTVITDLEPFTDYEFCVLSANMAGSTFSNWTLQRTAEAAPVFMPLPSVFPLSPYSLNVSWEKPGDNEARGEVMGYSVNVITEQKVLPMFSQTLYVAEAHEQSYVATGLDPYRMYSFTITLCNRIGCVDSKPGTGQTLAAAPVQLIAPSTEGINSTVIKITWYEPEELNGPPPVYQLERIDISLATSDVNVKKGTRFPGNGYYKFPNSMLPSNAYFTGIKISFKTAELDGLLFLSMSPGNQEEFIVLQLRKGRPYFLFDPQGSAIAVTPVNDGGRQYNDNNWHHLSAIRNQAFGTIIIDGQFSGSSSATSGSTIIGENTGIFVGGLPQDFIIERKDIGPTKIVTKGFVGCLHDIFLQKMPHPYEVWEPLKWGKALEQRNAYHSWEGCPTSLEDGAHFLGKGFLELHSNIFHGGMDFEISFMFKTDQFSGLLLFIYNKDGPDYIAAELKSGSLIFLLNNGIVSTHVNLWLGLSYCDGNWNKIILSKRGSVASAKMNEWTDHVMEPDLEQLFVNSPVYLGGTPVEVQGTFKELGLEQGFGGCMKDVKFTRSAVVNLASVSSSAVRVNLDGCLSTDSAVNCRGNDSILVYQGKKKHVYDNGLQPFTEYLYRVIASNEGGSVSSAWSRSRTRESVPQNVLTLSRIHSINGYNIEVTWDEPVGVKGVIEKYILKASSEDGSNISIVSTEISNTSSCTGLLTGLRPFANYAVTLMACTLAGCTESSHALNISTPQEAPQNVQPPTTVSFPTSLWLSWAPPKAPNGIITQYILYMNAQQIYTGNETKLIVKDLKVFTPYHFLISACTMVGCKNSTQITVFTTDLPPVHVDVPVLIILDSRTVEAQWDIPKEVNGLVYSYILYIAKKEKKSIVWDAIYNSTDLFQNYTIEDLSPGIEYFIKLAACTTGGCTISETISVKTMKTGPEGVPAPKVQSYSSDSFNISWTKPEYMNGFITSYGLYMNGILVQNSSELTYYISGLSPWSLHAFRVQACTANGCALGPLVKAHTTEDVPKGNIELFVINGRAKEVKVKWFPLNEPNGQITYAVLFTGIFYADKANSNYSILNCTQILHIGKEANIWVSIGGLIPFSIYTVEVNASNSQGYVISDPVEIVLPAGAPDGMLPPRLSSATPTSLQVLWSTPVRNNAPGLPRYRLQIRLKNYPENNTELFSKPTIYLRHILKDLQPYTSYELRVIACNEYGDTFSNWTLIDTEEDKPGPIDPPLILEVKSRETTISWQPPSRPNGIVTHYNIYQNNQLHDTIPGARSKHIASFLEPYTVYKFQVEGCTSKGCSLSSESLPIQTLPDVPEDIPAPELYSDTPTAVLVSWQPPLHPNGLVENFAIERRVKGTEQVSTVASFLSNCSKSYLDQSAGLSPWKKYEYRILASTFQGGINSSSWVEVITRPSRPENIQAPKVQALDPYTAQVSWESPSILNGEILSYEIHMPDPRITISNNLTTSMSHIVTNLIPFTNYSVTIEACVGGESYIGGCTKSLPTYMVTLPTFPQNISSVTVTPINESVITVYWQPPSKPNGHHIRYDLLRRKIQQPLASNPPEDLNLWDNIYSGTQWFYEDKGLSRNTTYAYKLIVHNEVGYTSSEEVVVTTLAGFSEKGTNLAAKPLNHTAIEVKWTTPKREGLFPPEIIVINSTAVHVIWALPSDSNDIVREYSIYVNNNRYETTIKVPGSFILGDLSPFTLYDIQVESCRRNACVRSNGTQIRTAEGVPKDLSPPLISVLGSRSLQINWTSPGQPNGIILGYELLRKAQHHCTEAKQLSKHQHEGIYLLLECNIHENICGRRCCNPQFKICRNGNQYNTPNFQCCEDKYLSFLLNASSACCGSQRCRVEPEYQCCGNYSTWIFIGMFCCRHEYLNMSSIVCCSAFNGEAKAHIKKNSSVLLKCCVTELIPESEECCNGLGYNPLKYVCTDRISSGTMMKIKEESKCIPLCSISTEAVTYCGQCNFDEHTCLCAWIKSSRSYTKNKENKSICPFFEEKIYTGGPTQYSFEDKNLEPHVTYEYRLAAWNKHGKDFSEMNSATTKQDIPECVSPPHWTKVDNHEDIIFLTWKEPCQPNGIIIYYIILRNGVEHFRGKELSFMDTSDIQPYQEYSYLLRACTVAGCSDSSMVIAVIVQGIPENVLPPTIIPLSATALHLSWVAPKKPNGLIREYHIHQIGKGLIYTGPADQMKHTVTDLQPYENYDFTLTACTFAGCTTSQTTAGRTLQAAPQGVWSQPRHITVSSKILELYWDEPEQTNGIVIQYRLFCNGEEIFKGGRENLNFTHSAMQPNKRYVYQLEASTWVGSNISEKYIVQTPITTPEEIHIPYNITVINAYSIFVAWDIPGSFKSNVPLEYNILLDAGSASPLVKPVGQPKFLLLDGLDPCTQYEIRIQACQNDGCGVGERVYATTAEDFPEDLSPPIISAIGPTYIAVKWSPPKKPNGIITNYFIYRRPMETQEEMLVFTWSEGILEFIDATDALQPFTEYDYCVKAQNSKGSVNSSWSSTQTLETRPSGMKSPSAQAISAHSVFLNWTSPASPNSAISQYHVVYQERQNDPTIKTQDALTVPGEMYQTYLFGLKPYTIYDIHIVAVNNAGQVASPWTSVRTLEASPSGLSNFTMDKKENGRALLLRWAEPSKPNGNIKIYNIFNDGNLEYSGLSRQFLFRRLDPFTEYTLILEACTAAGCTRSSPQQIWTDAAPPASQMAPVIHLVNATSIELSWSEPINSNGKIMRYEVIHRHTKENASGENRTTEEENIVFTEYNTGSNTFVYHAQHLQPWTTYEYKIRAWNSAGYTDSPWFAAKTSQAAPEGMAAPMFTYIPQNPSKIWISWSLPEKSNGVLLSYKLQRNDVPYPFSFDASTFNYTDQGLLPYTEYNYLITACTLGGCCSSDRSRIRTLEAAPAIVSPPTLEGIHSTQINISWAPPQIQNGEIIKYILKLNDEEQYVGKSLFKTVLNLQPYTKYDITLVACTNGGCTVSASQSAWTTEAPPLNLDPPMLLVTDSESLEITWKAPNNPNGKIQSYELRRNGLLVYSGLNRHYKDFMLTPGVEYIYTVTATNSQGSVTSQIAKIRTDPSAPSGMSPPLLHPWSSQTILVIWDPPAKINGNIINYTIILREPIKSQKKVIYLDSFHDSFGRQSYNLTELKPYHRYEVQVQACSLLGCTHSEWASIQTLEAPPEIQPAPFIDVQSSPDGFQTVLSIVWTGPKHPNGDILHYELYRRQPLPNQQNISLVYNGSSTSFKDDTLLPFTEYEYQVWSVNSAGRTASSWIKCKTGPAPPQGLPAPLFETVASTSAVVNIRPPLKPNGIITLYRFFSNSTKGKEKVLSEGTTAQQTIHGLKPFTTYSIGVEACTCFNCCSQGPMAQVTTQPAAPTQQPSPHIQNLTSRNASFLWDAPQEPNGIVRRYELHMYTSCLPWLLPIDRVCKPGPIEVRYSGKNRHSSVSDLQPYTTYKLKVVSYNSAGSTTSEWITFTTEKEVPQYKSPFIIIGNLSTIFLDWSHTFLLNGLLKEYVLMEGGQHIYSGFDTRLYLPRTSDKIYLFQVICITDEGSAETPVIKYNAAIGFGPVLTTPGENNKGNTKQAMFYTELWFVILMAILALILLAIFLSLILQRKINKQLYSRERPPLVSVQKRMSPMNVYSQGETHMPPIATSLQVPVISSSQVSLSSDKFERVADTSESSCSITLKSYTMHLEGLADTKIPGPASPSSIHSSRSISVLQRPSQSQIEDRFSQDSLHRSVSQLIEASEKKSSVKDIVWDAIIHGHDSSLCADDEDLVSTIKSFSTVTKAHTTFTDTHL